MYKITIGIDGMACSMCEAHVNDTIRANFKVKKVNSSHTKNLTEILCPKPITEDALHAAIDPTGYTVTSFTCEELDDKKGKEKKGA